uniref:MARVEL domain-containing protein 1 n=1 Tax=Myxine glutinosa TaxID=7769 RepID=UPI0035901D5A
MDDTHPGHSSAGSEGLPTGRRYACGVRGVLRALQCASTGAAWLCVAHTRYRGAAHCAVLVAVLAWLFTLVVYVLSVLGKYERLPVVGGGGCGHRSRNGGGGDDPEGVTRRWLTANVLLDAVLAPLLVLGTGLAAREAHAASWCHVPEYGSSCPFALFVAAAVLMALGVVLSVVSALLHWRLRSSA